MRFLNCGEKAVLCELEDLSEVLGLYAALRRDPPEGVVELVPAARTVLVGFDPGRTDLNRICAEVTRREGEQTSPAGAPEVEIPVRYDGADLDDVARMTGMSPRDVVARHTGGDYTAAFCGFSPGFAYITGLDPLLHVPRHPTPRTKVPPGAVALADRYTGVYPRSSPGGWRVVGHTDMPVWDLDRDPPAVLSPGTRIRFVELAKRSNKHSVESAAP
ncbi:MAG: 5-oxoprolinase subunit B family protein [Stackebrandtia sp.]